MDSQVTRLIAAAGEPAQWKARQGRFLLLGRLKRARAPYAPVGAFALGGRSGPQRQYGQPKARARGWRGEVEATIPTRGRGRFVAQTVGSALFKRPSVAAGRRNHTELAPITLAGNAASAAARAGRSGSRPRCLLPGIQPVAECGSPGSRAVRPGNRQRSSGRGAVP